MDQDRRGNDCTIGVFLVACCAEFVTSGGRLGKPPQAASLPHEELKWKD